MNTVGTGSALARLGLTLADGLEIRISDGELVANAIIRPPGPEGVWRAQVNWDEIEYAIVTSGET